MGVIALSAKKAFINRKRKDFRKYKDLTEEQLEQMMLQLPVQPPLYYKLTKLQKTCFLIGVLEKKFYYTNDCGTGKTLLSIALGRYFRRLGSVKRILVLVPSRPVKGEWVDELQKHSPTSSYLVLGGATEDKWKNLETTNTLFVVETYGGLYRLVTDKKVVKGKNKFVLNKSKLKKLCGMFQGLICDESVHLGNHRAMPFRICRKISQSAEIVFPLTATPFNREPELMWAQMFLVDGGYTLGETLGMFRAIFCKEVPNYFTGFDEAKFDKDKEELLHEFLANKSISYQADEASLPECVQVEKYVDISDDALQYYDKFKKDLIAAKGNFRETKNAFLRLRQISSGFIGYEDDETGARSKFEFPENPKLELLLSIIQSIPKDQKVIVFFEFTYSGEKVLQELKKLKIDAVLLNGNTKDPVAVKKSFMGKSQVLILQNRFGEGLNIQVARYCIFWESPVSAIVRKQCERRVKRQHSSHKTVFIYDILVRGTVDESIRLMHKEGNDLFEAIIKGDVKI